MKLKHNEIYYLHRIAREYVKYYEIPQYYYNKYCELLDIAIKKGWLHGYYKNMYIDYKNRMFFDTYTLVRH